MPHSNSSWSSLALQYRGFTTSILSSLCRDMDVQHFHELRIHMLSRPLRSTESWFSVQNLLATRQESGPLQEQCNYAVFQTQTFNFSVSSKSYSRLRRVTSSKAGSSPPQVLSSSKDAPRDQESLTCRIVNLRSTKLQTGRHLSPLSSPTSQIQTSSTGQGNVLRTLLPDSP